MKAFLSRSVASFAAIAACVSAQAPEVELPITARSKEVESDWTAVAYNRNAPFLVGNDGGAASGGLRVFELNDSNPLPEIKHVTPGRTKLVTVAHGVGKKDLILTIAQTDSYFRIYDAATLEQLGEPTALTLGDWSSLCTWKSQASGETYVYLFGKGQARIFLLRPLRDSHELVEIQSFDTPVEASACAVSLAAETVYFSGDDARSVYSFPATESIAAPLVTTLGHAEDDVTGLAIYFGRQSDHLLVAQKDIIAVYDTEFQLLGTIKLIGDDDIEVQGLGIYQGSANSYPFGALTYAVESDAGAGFGASSLEAVFAELGLESNTAYDPHKSPCKPYSPVCDECNKSGFCVGGGKGAGAPACGCFAGFVGSECQNFACTDDCSSHGTCVGAKKCDCEAGWGGLHCAFKVVTAVVETDANGGDGDDPAIWVSPVDKGESRVITTTKSDEGAGIAVFDLSGKLLQAMPGAQPNNVDIIYGFQAGERTVDLAYAACRTDNTLCLWEVTADGTLVDIAGGSQPTKEDYDVYGSCVYHSWKTGKQYLFVNAKTAEYMQYELTWADDALQTAIVRNFTGGAGGQVEGCVADNANGWILIGEEPYGLWRYGAEPEDDSSRGYLVDSIEGGMYADVEGVSLVEGATKDAGFIIVSQQGVSAYNVYRRSPPHVFVETFTIAENKALGIDAVSNTDGLVAIGTGLGSAFPNGLVVVHDDSNQLPDGTTSDEASYKFVSLAAVLPDKLLAELDVNWDPRARL
ncbi:3-phytase [Microdochium nivale]|nr:3-phytase [Microdochium nivale]